MARKLPVYLVGVALALILAIATPARAIVCEVLIQQPLAHVTTQYNVDLPSHVEHYIAFDTTEVTAGQWWLTYRGVLYQDDFQGYLADAYGSDGYDAPYDDMTFDGYYDTTRVQLVDGGRVQLPGKEAGRRGTGMIP